MTIKQHISCQVGHVITPPRSPPPSTADDSMMPSITKTIQGKTEPIILSQSNHQPSSSSAISSRPNDFDNIMLRPPPTLSHFNNHGETRARFSMDKSIMDNSNRGQSTTSQVHRPQHNQFEHAATNPNARSANLNEIRPDSIRNVSHEGCHEGPPHWRDERMVNTNTLAFAKQLQQQQQFHQHCEQQQQRLQQTNPNHNLHHPNPPSQLSLLLHHFQTTSKPQPLSYQPRHLYTTLYCVPPSRTTLPLTAPTSSNPQRRQGVQPEDISLLLSIKTIAADQNGGFDEFGFCISSTGGVQVSNKRGRDGDNQEYNTHTHNDFDFNTPSRVVNHYKSNIETLKILKEKYKSSYFTAKPTVDPVTGDRSTSISNHPSYMTTATATIKTRHTPISQVPVQDPSSPLSPELSERSSKAAAYVKRIPTKRLSTRLFNEPQFFNLLTLWETHSAHLGAWSISMHQLLKETFPELLTKYGYFDKEKKVHLCQYLFEKVNKRREEEGIFRVVKGNLKKGGGGSVKKGAKRRRVV